MIYAEQKCPFKPQTCESCSRFPYMEELQQLPHPKSEWARTMLKLASDLTVKGKLRETEVTKQSDLFCISYSCERLLENPLRQAETHFHIRQNNYFKYESKSCNCPVFPHRQTTSDQVYINPPLVRLVKM